MNCVDIIEEEHSFGLIIRETTTSNPCNVILPTPTQENANDIYFHFSEDYLNEFGAYYVSLFIMANYARYYQDKWMKDMEQNEPISLIAKKLMDTALERAPLLILGELSSIQFVVE